jgi:Transposase DDE domain
VPDTITKIADAMQTVLDDVPDQNARATGFLKRRRKLTAAVFVKTLVFGFLANPHASLDELTRVAKTLGVTITPQALDERLTPAAAEMLRLVLQAAIDAMITADPVSLAILDRFTEVVVLDSSTVTLPEEFQTQWPGCGTVNPAKGNAAFKLSLAFDLKGGRLRGPTLEPGRLNDKKTTLADEVLPVAALRIADLGYFKIATLRQMDRHGVFFLSRYQVGTVIRDAQGRRWPRLSLWLPEGGARVDQRVLLGERERLPCRLLAVRVPEAVAAQRVRRLEEEAARDGRNLSPECVALASWTVFVTNVPPNRLNVEEALALGRARWQIELLFKQWKSHGGIDQWQSAKPAKILCEVYAKLIAMVVQHWVTLVSSWEHVDRSLVKVCQTIRQYAWQLAAAVGARLEVRRIVKTLRTIFETGCRMNKRRKHPNTYQRLRNLRAASLT